MIFMNILIQDDPDALSGRTGCTILGFWSGWCRENNKL